MKNCFPKTKPPASLGGVRGLLFDLDGTLIDSLEDLTAAGNYIRGIRGLKPLAEKKVATYVGEGVQQLVSRLLRTTDPRDVERMAALFIRRYQGHCVDATRLYPGARRALKALRARGYRLAVVTNKTGRVSRRILSKLSVAGYFRSVVGGDSTAFKKPDPQPLRRAARELDLRPAQCVMIGDSFVDVEAGKAARMRTIALKGGIGNPRKMKASKPDYICERFSRLLEILPGFQNR